MSIDSGHRRGVCDLLKVFQTKRQFIITTHDTAWAKQLKAQGIVKRNNLIHFMNWHISTGPMYELEKDLWVLMAEDLAKDQPSVAAARLRRNTENFFDDVCDYLGASIRYKGIHQWELGDYAPAAIEVYKKHLRKAKNNAIKLKDAEKQALLEKLETDSTAIITRTQIEQWLVNENVHYNKWESFRKRFCSINCCLQNLFNLFSCQKCGTLLSYSEDPIRNRADVSCNCGNIFLECKRQSTTSTHYLIRRIRFNWNA